MILYRELEAEKYWNIMNNDPQKRAKISRAIESDMYGATIKKDGEYIRAIYDTDGEVWVMGRNTKSLTVVNLKEHLAFIAQWLTTHYTPGTCIMGELFLEGKTSRSIRKYTGSLLAKSLAEQKKEPPSFMVFDAWAINGQNLLETPYQKRMEIIKNHFPASKQIGVVDVVIGADNIFRFIKEALDSGQEGVVLSRLDGVPKPGSRITWKHIKVKKEFDEPIDCFFTGAARPSTRLYTGKEIEKWPYWENYKSDEKYDVNMYKEYAAGMTYEPITKPYYNGWPGSLEVGVMRDGKVVSLCYLSGLSDELRADYLVNPQAYAMRPIAITGMDTTDESIRHPKFLGFRDDLPVDDCTWEKIFGVKK